MSPIGAGVGWRLARVVLNFEQRQMTNRRWIWYVETSSINVRAEQRVRRINVRRENMIFLIFFPQLISSWCGDTRIHPFDTLNSIKIFSIHKKSTETECAVEEWKIEWNWLNYWNEYIKERASERAAEKMAFDRVSSDWRQHWNIGENAQHRAPSESKWRERSSRKKLFQVAENRVMNAQNSTFIIKTQSFVKSSTFFFNDFSSDIAEVTPPTLLDAPNMEKRGWIVCKKKSYRFEISINPSMLNRGEHKRHRNSISDTHMKWGVKKLIFLLPQHTHAASHDSKSLAVRV